MRISFKIFFLVFLFGICTESFGQCKQLYLEGVKLMNKKEWRLAIDKFKAAKVCDSKLTKDCDKQIKICSKHLRTSDPTPAPDNTHYLNLDPASLTFTDDRYAKLVEVKSIVKGKEAEWSYSIQDAADCSWLYCKENEGKLQVWCSSNTDMKSRSGYITVDNGKDKKVITVTQVANDTLYVESDDGNPKNVQFKLKGGQKTIRVVCPDYDFRIKSQPNYPSLKISRDGAHITITATKANDKWEDYLIIESRSGKTEVIKIAQKKKFLGMDSVIQ